MRIINMLRFGKKRNWNAKKLIVCAKQINYKK